MSEEKLYAKALSLAKAGQLQRAKDILEELDSAEARKLLNRVNSAISARKQDALQQHRPAPQNVPVLPDYKKMSKAKNAPSDLTGEIAKSKPKANPVVSLLAIVVICGVCWLASMGATPKQSPTSNSNATTGDAALIESAIELVTDIDLSSIQIVDRAGGGRTIILSYTTHATNENELFAEYGSIFGAVGETVRQFNIDADELGFVVGNSAGMATESVAVQISDILAFLDGRISVETFYSRITRVDL